MAKSHTRLSCPCCGMLTSPGRLDQDFFPVKFASVSYRSAGRDKGFYHWDHQPDVPDRGQLLASLHAKLTRCIAMLELEPGFSESKLPSASTLVQPVPMVRLFPRLRRRGNAVPTVRLNPILGPVS